MTSGTVYLVGAGPGHPGLVTLRAVECLSRADVVLYDYLVNPRTLVHANPNAQRICLGQHRRADIWSQEAINEELVQRARLGQTVVRLKGGDPMIFGRVADEVAALHAAGVEFEIVPGVTAASAAAAFAGVPITDRNHASAVALVTGHEQLGKPESAVDYQALANFPGTLVIYMGVRTAMQWSQALLDAGKAPDTPVLLVRRCSWPDQTKISCSLSEVGTRVTPHQKFPPPAVIIVGEAARATPATDWYSKLPLLGRNIVVTRPVHQAAASVSRLVELGANAIVQPAIEIRDPCDWGPVDRVISRLDDFDHVVFSSSNGVHYFMRRLLEFGGDARQLGHVKLSVIGPRTGVALLNYGLRADIQPSSYRAEALAKTLILSQEVAGQKFLLLRASRGRELLAEELRRAGGTVEQVVVYQSDDVTTLNEPCGEAWANDAIDWVTVTSSAIAKSVCRLFGSRLQQVKLASISPITSDTLRSLSLEPSAEALEFTSDGVIDAILRAEQSE